MMRSYNTLIYTKIIELKWDVENSIIFEDDEQINKFEAYYHAENIYRDSFIVFLIVINTNKTIYRLNLTETYDLLEFVPLLKVNAFSVKKAIGAVTVTATRSSSKISFYTFYTEQLMQDQHLVNALNNYRKFKENSILSSNDEMIAEIRDLLSNHNIEYTDNGSTIDLTSKYNNMQIPYKTLANQARTIIQPNVMLLDNCVCIGNFIKYKNELTKFKSPALITECPSCKKYSIINWSEIKGTNCLSCGKRIVFGWKDVEI